MNYNDSIYFDFNKTNACKIKFFKQSLLKGKIEKDTLLIAKSYYALSYFCIFEKEVALAYADSLNRLPLKRINTKQYIFAPYAYASIFYFHEIPKKALDYSFESFHRAKSEGNIFEKIKTMQGVSDVYSAYNNSNKSLKISHKIIRLIKANESKFGNKGTIILIDRYHQIIGDHLKLYQYDSANYYLKKTFEKHKQLDYRYSNEYGLTKTREAELNYYIKKYSHSKSIFDSLLPYETELHSIINIKYYLGMIAGHEGNSERKLTTFKEIDSLMNTYSGPLFSTHDTYTFLLEDAVKNGRQVEQLTYLNKLIRFDSIEASNALYIQNKDKLNFELDELRKMREQLKRENTNKMLILWIGIAVITALALSFFLYSIKMRQQQLVLQEKLKQPIELKTKSDKEHKTSTELDEQFTSILNSLNTWEQEKKYTNTNITLPTLADELNTNAAYLSKAINQFKGHSFSNYLKDLRITHLINFLNENPEFIKGKSVVQIAEHFGFNSKDVFSRTLKQKLGVTPSLFFKTILTSD